MFKLIISRFWDTISLGSDSDLGGYWFLSNSWSASEDWRSFVVHDGSQELADNWTDSSVVLTGKIAPNVEKIIDRGVSCVVSANDHFIRP